VTLFLWPHNSVFLLICFQKANSYPWTKREPIEAGEGVVGEGAALFNQRCSVCHYPDKTDNKLGPSLLGLFKGDKLPVSGRPLTEENIRIQLKTPFKQMPPFADLSEEQMASLIAYLKTL